MDSSVNDMQQATAELASGSKASSTILTVAASRPAGQLTALVEKAKNHQ